MPRMADSRDVSTLIDTPLPDLALPATTGPFAFRGCVGVRPQVLFFYLRNGTAT
jgi:hypothetical protein